MSTISKDAAEIVARRACAASFEANASEYQAQEAALAERCWAAVLPENERRLAESLPDGWIRRDKCLCFNAAGWRVILNHPTGLVIPSGVGFCKEIGALPAELGKEVQAFIQRKEQAKERRREAERELLQSIRGARTWKRLAEAWPEGKPFFEGFLAAATGSRALAIPFTKINETLGLPSLAAPAAAE